MEKEELKEYLLDELDVQPAYVDDMIGQIEAMDGTLKEAFDAYRRTGELPKAAIGNYNCNDLVETHQFTAVGALLFLDWMEKEPEAANAALLFF